MVDIVHPQGGDHPIDAGTPVFTPHAQRQAAAVDQTTDGAPQRGAPEGSGAVLHSAICLAGCAPAGRPRPSRCRRRSSHPSVPPHRGARVRLLAPNRWSLSRSTRLGGWWWRRLWRCGRRGRPTSSGSTTCSRCASARHQGWWPSRTGPPWATPTRKVGYRPRMLRTRGGGGGPPRCRRPRIRTHRTVLFLWAQKKSRVASAVDSIHVWTKASEAGPPRPQWARLVTAPCWLGATGKGVSPPPKGGLLSVEACVPPTPPLTRTLSPTHTPRYRSSPCCFTGCWWRSPLTDATARSLPATITVMGPLARRARCPPPPAPFPSPSGLRRARPRRRP